MAEPDPLFVDPKLQYQTLNNLFRLGLLDVFETCPKFIQMAGAFMRKIDPKTGEVTDDFDDAPYHLLACARYGAVKLRPPELTGKIIATNVVDTPAPPAAPRPTGFPGVPQRQAGALGGRSQPNPARGWDLTGRSNWGR